MKMEINNIEVTFVHDVTECEVCMTVLIDFICGKTKEIKVMNVGGSYHFETIRKEEIK